MITVNNALTRKFEQAWTIDFVYRLADLHWREWGSRLGIDIRCLGFSPYRSPGSELIWQWASANGIPGSEAPLEMARRLGLKLYLKQRLLFSEKANYVRLGAVPFPLQLDILPSPLGPLGFRQEAFFPYTTPDGKSASGGVAYLRDDEGIQSGFPSPRGKTNFVRFCGIGSLGGLHSLCLTYTSFLLVETPRSSSFRPKRTRTGSARMRFG